MTLTLLDIYNFTTGQARSMFDTDATNKSDFESSVLSSIQKALTEIWCSYEFPFRLKTLELDYPKCMDNGMYNTVPGTIVDKNGVKIKEQKLYSGTTDNDYYQKRSIPRLVDYSSIEDLEYRRGVPESWYIKNRNYEEFCLYPLPESDTTVYIDYYSLQVGCDKDGNPVTMLKEETDYIDIPDRYEGLFLNALATKAMVYIIASPNNEYYSGYVNEAEKAYRALMKNIKGVNSDIKVSW